MQTNGYTQEQEDQNKRYVTADGSSRAVLSAQNEPTIAKLIGWKLCGSTITKTYLKAT